MEADRKAYREAVNEISAKMDANQAKMAKQEVLAEIIARMIKMYMK
jgi:hypothetical protein